MPLNLQKLLMAIPSMVWSLKDDLYLGTSETDPEEEKYICSEPRPSLWDWPLGRKRG